VKSAVHMFPKSCGASLTDLMELHLGFSELHIGSSRASYSAGCGTAQKFFLQTGIILKMRTVHFISAGPCFTRHMAYTWSTSI